MKKQSSTELDQNQSSSQLEDNSINHKNQTNFSGALILITIGVILLLNNFGFLPWSIWRDLWRIWPVFLIFWGFKIIFGNSKTANILMIIISLLTALFFLLIILSNTNPEIRNYIEKNFPLINLPRYENNNEVTEEEWQLEFEQDWKQDRELP